MANNQESKFNFSEDDEKKAKEEAVEQSKQALKQDAKGFFASFKQFFRDLLDFRHDTDRDATIEAIKGDIPFRGATAWILICSIMVASVGLNANSTAVVIGAMLISPLMGPILGVGMSIALNDIDTLKSSLINLATMIVLSLLTAFLFFRFFPLSEDTSELLGRVKPDIRDVLIAFFGGLALIIARTKKGTIASVIFGVAIATALMPPLCTAGYGLAKANWDYFFGAMYLFTINTIFIALATFLVLKVLRFPMLRYANSKKRKRIARLASLTALIVMIPAGITFWDVYKESRFEVDAKAFRDNELETLPNSNYIKKNASFVYGEDGSESIIELIPFGTDEISEEREQFLKSRLKAYPALANTRLEINQVKNRAVNNLEYMEELRTRDSLDLLSQSQKISFLEDRVRSLSRLERDQIAFDELIKGLKIDFERLEQLSFANEISTKNLSSIDTLKVFSVKWIDSVSTEETKLKDTDRLRRSIKERLDLDTLVVRRTN